MFIISRARLQVHLEKESLACTGSRRHGPRSFHLAQCLDARAFIPVVREGAPPSTERRESSGTSRWSAPACTAGDGDRLGYGPKQVQHGVDRPSWAGPSASCGEVGPGNLNCPISSVHEDLRCTDASRNPPRYRPGSAIKVRDSGVACPENDASLPVVRMGLTNIHHPTKPVAEPLRAGLESHPWTEGKSR
jgi:hypothetical protein